MYTNTPSAVEWGRCDCLDTGSAPVSLETPGDLPTMNQVPTQVLEFQSGPLWT